MNQNQNPMQLEATRERVSTFLRHHLNQVSSIEEARPGSIAMNAYIKEWDDTHECGTVCCMEGWLPSTYPEIFKWILIGGCVRSVRYRKDNGYIHTPVDGLHPDMWAHLTGVGGGHFTENALFGMAEGETVRLPYIGLTSTWPEVKAAWEIIIELIEEGKLDSALTTDEFVYEPPVFGIITQ